MKCLIGAGSHATDIRRQGFIALQLSHHSEWSGQLPVIIGINNPQLRAKVATELEVEDDSWVHPDAQLWDTSLGYGTHVNYGVRAVRTRIGNHCTLSPGAIICGDVTIGDRVLIGAGSVICDRVTIGDGATIGAGAVVLPESYVPSGDTWIGIPARWK